MSQRKSLLAGWLPGILLVLLGGVLLFDKSLFIRMIESFFRTLDRWWPMLFVAFGLFWLLAWKPRRKLLPILLICGGLVAQGEELGLFPWWTWEHLWPVLLIVAGLWLLYCRTRRVPGVSGPAPMGFAPGDSGVASDADTSDSTKSSSAKEVTGEAVDAFVMFGGLERAATSQSFRGGEATAVFGGIDLDLRRAQLAPGDQRMKLFALFGGIEIIVPRDMPVVLQGTPILGSIGDSREHPPAKEVTAADLAAAPIAPASRLIVDGFAMFGGIEVKA